MKHFAWIVLICLASPETKAQVLPPDSLISRFEEYREHSLQEKVYAHLDRNFYLTGEILWFSLYVVDGSFHRPLGMSKVAYVEILDGTDQPVLQAKIGLERGSGSGSFFIPASLSTGNYRFRAYTSWMKNFKAEFYFQQTISIVNTFVTPVAGGSPAATAQIDFFPEGGHLVAGLTSKVAFKITGAGVRKPAVGALIDPGGDTVATFLSDRNGMGHFYLKPGDVASYKAVIGDKRRSWSNALPAVQPAGYVMHLKDSGDIIQIISSGRGVQDNTLFLFAHSRQIIVHAEARRLESGRAEFTIRKDALPGGVCHFTLFNQTGQPVCERLYFTPPTNFLKFDMSVNQKVFLPRRKATVYLQTASEANTAAPARVSVAVYKVDSLKSADHATILQYLWLNSDLQGYIPPLEGLSGNGAAAQIDNLMLTHGWRKFDWSDVLNADFSYPHLPEIREHIVTGVVTMDGRRQKGVFTYLGSPGKIIRAYGSWSNTEGQVRFEIKDFYGPRRIILQPRPDSAQSYEVQIQNPFSSDYAGERIPALRLNSRLAEPLLERSIAMQVQDIYYFDRYGERIITPNIDSTAFYGVPDATYHLDDYTRFPVMEEVMREYVPGVFVRKRRDGFHFLVVDKVYDGVLQGDPMVLLDGVPIADVDDVMKINPLLVKKLDVVNRTYYLGQAVFSGIVSYTTYRGDLGDLELDPQSVSLNYEGLQLKREFHSPQHSRDSENDRLPDQRHLLYWVPDLETNDEGRAQISFFTSDVPGTYIIMAEGLDASGRCGTATLTFEVDADDHP